LTHIRAMVLATVEIRHCHGLPRLGRFPVKWNHLIEKESLTVRSLEQVIADSVFGDEGLVTLSVGLLFRNFNRNH
jgi:hypothetical protein